MSIGKRINKYRKQMSLCQEALGDKLNVSRQAVYKWESDLSLPDSNNLIELSKIFGVSLSELIREENSSNTIIVNEPLSKRSDLNRLFSKVMTVIIVLLIVAIGIQALSISKMRSQITYLNQLVIGMNMNNPGNYPVLPSQPDLFNHFSFDLVKVDYGQEQMTYKIDFSMKVEYKDALYTLNVNDTSYELVKDSKRGFTKEIVIPFVEKMDVSLFIDNHDELVTYPVYEGNPLRNIIFAYDTNWLRVNKGNLYFDLDIPVNVFAANHSFGVIFDEGSLDTLVDPKFTYDDHILSHFNFSIVESENSDKVISVYDKYISGEFGIEMPTLVFEDVVKDLDRERTYELYVSYNVDNVLRVSYKMSTLIPSGESFEIRSELEEHSNKYFKFNFEQISVD